MKRTTILALLILPGLLFAESSVSPGDFGTEWGSPESDSWEASFQNPPVAARTWTYWMRMNGCATKEGITADLEAMKRGGLGGAQMFDVRGRFGFEGPVTYLSPEWLELARHTASEAKRLGLHLAFHNCSGWSSSGGPWVKPAQSMQTLVSSRIMATGPGKFDAVLPQPPTNHDYYQDTAVVAYPVQGDRVSTLEELAPKVTSNAPDFDPALVLDGKEETMAGLPVPAPGKPVFIDLEFAAPYTARAFSLNPGISHHGYHGQLQVSDDGKDYRTVREWWIRHARGKRSFAFPAVTARHFRILFEKADRDNYITMNLGDLDFTSEVEIDDWEQKAGYQPYPKGKVPVQVVEKAEAMPVDQVIDLTAMMTPDGRLSWEVPPGKWAILRMGHTPLGGDMNYNNPASTGGRGFECDKFDAEAVKAFWAGGPAKILEELKPYVGTTLTEVAIDSYERGQPNWTAKLPREFERLRGYRMTRYLPVLTGRVVGSLEESERFLWDVRRTIADLFAENYAGTIAKLAHENNLQFALEGGGFVSDALQYLGKSDMPTAETWIKGNPSRTCMPAAAAHVYGRRLVGDEIMTATPENERWTMDPFGMKALGDAAYCAGINRFVFHVFAHQPWFDRGPGMTMGQWGSHLDRNNTWWDQGTDWRIYLARCQYLLQQGENVADGLGFCGESVPTGGAAIAMPPGYNFDVCNADVILNRLSVKEGRLALPTGITYAFLGLGDVREMTPPVLKKIRQLIEEGATVVGPRPFKSPSLAGYPQCDQEIQTLAEQVWGPCDGGKIKENPFGRGRVICGMSTAEVLQRLQVEPDFEHAGKDFDIRYVHRQTAGADIYFVSNQEDIFVQTTATFRVSGRIPELWHAGTGKIEMAPLYEDKGGRTAITLGLEPRGSVFVIFRKASTGGDHLVSAKKMTKGSAPSYSISVQGDGRALLRAWEPGTYEFTYSDGRTSQVKVEAVPQPITIGGPWELSFPPNLGAPEKITLKRLISWPDHEDPGVRYFSGTATYAKTFSLPADLFGKGRSVYLDLGEVKNLARIKLNGKDLGVVWKPPYRVDITEAAKAGDNKLAIELTNLWPNRLIGDEQLPPDREWEKFGGLKKFPAWFREGKKSPTGRIAFTTWHHWNKDGKLLPSGLLGPVRILSARQNEIN